MLNIHIAAHMWYDNHIVEADTSDEQSTGKHDKSSTTWNYLARIGALCNRADFKADQDSKPILQRWLSLAAQ